MKLTTRDNRPVEVEFEVSREPEDCFVANAYYLDEEMNGDFVSVPDNVLEELNEDNGDALYEQWQDHLISAADFEMDRQRDEQYE